MDNTCKHNDNKQTQKFPFHLRLAFIQRERGWGEITQHPLPWLLTSTESFPPFHCNLCNPCDPFNYATFSAFNIVSIAIIGNAAAAALPWLPGCVDRRMKR